MGPIRLVVVDDHAVVREGLRFVLAAAEGIVISGEAASISEGLDVIVPSPPDVVLLDVRLPDGSGLDLARQLCTLAPTVRCLLFSALPAQSVHLRPDVPNVVGHLSKAAWASDIAEAVHAAAGAGPIVGGGHGGVDTVPLPLEAFDEMLVTLTPYERRVLDLVAQGDPNRDIATRLGIAEKTARNYVSTILSKLGLRNRTQLAVYVAGLRAQQDRLAPEAGRGLPGAARAPQPPLH